MMGICGKSSGILLTITAAVALGLFFAPFPVWAADPIVSGNLIKGNPQAGDQFNINKGDMPEAPGSWFRNPNASGGYSPSGGTVTLSNGDVTGSVYGGIDPASTGDNGVSSANKVTITNVTIKDNVTGGWSRSGTADNNEITISDAATKVGGLVYGGWVRGGTSVGGGANENTVTIENGAFSDNIYGGYSQGSNGTVNKNIVTIKGGTISKGRNPIDSPHIIAGGYSSVGSNKEVKGNTVNIDGGTIINFWIYGGRGQTNATEIVGNNVNITGGTIRGAESGDGINHAGDRGSYIYGGEGIAGSARVQNNNVKISSGATVTATIYGGYARAGGEVTNNGVTLDGGTTTGTVYGGYSVSGPANNNEVNLTGGALTGTIYGGYSGRGSAAHNVVNLTDGTLAGDGRVYGGQSGSGGDAFTDNTLNKKKADIKVTEARNFQNVNFTYSGDGKANIDLLDTTVRGSGESGVKLSTGNNDITFDGKIIGSGDLTKTGDGTLIVTDDDNKIDHLNGVTIAKGTLQIGTGGFTGNFATPQFTIADADAVLEYKRSDEIIYDGQISGEGTLKQTGDGDATGDEEDVLILTGNSSKTLAKAEITSSTLQLGNGGASGSLNAKEIAVGSDATLAYKRSDAVSYTGHITGAGKVVQRGSGSLLLNDAANPNNTTLPRNTFTGGTEIESGTLNIVDLTSYNQVVWSGMASALQTANDQTKAGYITFTGQEGPKYAILRSGVIPGSEAGLHNSFRTDSTAGRQNNVDLTAMPVVIRGNNLSNSTDKGGAFYVADYTAMNVNASRLILGGDNDAVVKGNAVGETYFNKSQDGSKNDLYIGQGAEFNLFVDDYATFNSGIDGDTTSTGVLNLKPLASSSARSYASVYLINNTSSGGEQKFHTGTTNVEGTAEKAIILNLTRGRIEEGDIRVTLENSDSFNLKNQYTLLSADGTIKAEKIQVEGAGLYPHAMSRHDMDYNEQNSPGTLLLEADDITLNDFSMLYDIKGPQEKLKDETSTGLTNVSNNSLLDFSTTGGKVTLNNGSVYFRTTTGSPFKTDDYLVMRSNNGFQNDSGDIDDYNVNDSLKAYIDGFELDSNNGTVRGGGMNFRMGSDPDANGNNNIPGTGNNIWLSAALNSLSMDWTGATGNEFKSGDLFNSEQGDDSDREHSFMPGDKVYVSKAGANIELLSPGEAGSPGALTGIAVTVSGMVIGKNTDGDIAAGGSYTFSGEGGLTADEGSAHGQFLADVDDEEDTSGETTLRPTGKLEKFGNGTLTFRNEGTNVFAGGIELSGGTTQFTRAEQLVDASYMKAQSVVDGPFTYTPNPSDGGTKFLQNSTLEALADVELYNHITIDTAEKATLSAAKGSTFTYHGILTGASGKIMEKTGAGTLEMFSDLDTSDELAFAGLMTVNEGILDIQGTFKDAAVEVYGDNGSETLSGTGVLKAGRVFAKGTLAPGTIDDDLEFKETLAFDAGSHFRVSLENNGAAPKSEYVKVGGQTSIADSEAILDVVFDYWNSKAKLTDVYRIIEAAGGQTNQADEFTLGDISSLPRGLRWEQGWNLEQRSGDEYQLHLVRAFDDGVDDTPGLSHNENEVGKIIDDMVGDPDGPLKDIVERVTDPNISDDELRRRLNQLTGDLTANALYMAFKEPWRHPFNRLNHGSAAPPAGEAGSGPRLWAEYTARYEETESDGNAHDFTIERYGLALGLDHQLSPRLTLGANLQFSQPTLKQDTGEVTADDLELGIYGLAAVADNWDMKMYLGYSWQNYDFERKVFLPASSKYTAFHDDLKGETDGRAIAASIELIRPIDIQPNFRLSPIAALDYEKIWVDAYKESGGLSALAYDDTEMERLTLRAGLAGEYTWQDRATLKARAQYGQQIGGQDYPSVGVRFAGSALSRRADIRGLESGRHYLNLGLGGNLKIGDRENSLLYLNYDAKLNNRTSIHAAEAGLMLTWQ